MCSWFVFWYCAVLCVVLLCFFVCFILFFFFKQKTAYEMRISDWSSDVCSSDLRTGHVALCGDERVAGGSRARCRQQRNGARLCAGQCGRARTGRSCRTETGELGGAGQRPIRPHSLQSALYRG